MITRDIALVMAAGFFYMASPMLVAPLVAGFGESLGAGGAVMGVIGGAMSLCSLLCRPFIGDLTDRISKYKLSFLGAGFMLLACVGYIISGNIPVLVVSRLLHGIGMSCCSISISTWMSELLPPDKIGSGMGVYGTMNALAMAVAPSIGVTVSGKLGYRAAFTISLLFTLGVMLFIQLVRDKGMPTAKPRTGGRVRLQLVDKNVIPVAIVIMLFTLPYCATQSFLVSYVGVKGLAVNVSIFFPVYAVFLLVLRLSMKELFDRLPFGVFLAGSCASAFLSMLCLHTMRGNGLMLLGALLMAGGYGLMCSVCQSRAILLAGPGRRGLANSTYYLGFDCGMAFGPMIGGALYGAADIRRFYPILMLTVPLCGLVHMVNIISKKKRS